MDNGENTVIDKMNCRDCYQECQPGFIYNRKTGTCERKTGNQQCQYGIPEPGYSCIGPVDSNGRCNWCVGVAEQETYR